MIFAFSPSLPEYALYPASVLLGVVLVVAVVRVREPTARFVMIAIWLRTMLSAYHGITYQPALGGLSINALASAAVFAVGLWIARPRGWRLKALVPVYGLIAMLAISGALNRELVNTANAAVKWGYFLVILLCAYQAVRRMGHAAFAGALLAAFAPPVVLQWISVALDVSKRADASGARSYIGGYEHEAAFSVILVGALWVTAFATRVPSALRHLIAGVLIFGLYLAVYRTTILAAAPLAAAYVTAHMAAAFRRSDRAAVASAASLVAIGGAAFLVFLMREQLVDFTAVFGGVDWLRPPEHFTEAERGLFSARLYLWSQYLDAWQAGGLQALLFGFGPESWQGRFSTYAHNTLVSALYETGLFGAAATLALWGFMAAQALRAPDPMVRLLLLSGHLAFFLINLATMGFWLIEGLILYALICAFTLAHARARAGAPALLRISPRPRPQWARAE